MEGTKGKVYLVGAGPGDTGLLTVKGMRCLRRAQVVVYDFHLNAQVLNYISHDAEFIYAGKRGGHHAMAQDEINRILVEKALEGRTVCRLKGGDPFVFGRGGEEAQALAAAGVEFEVVPGVSSAIAAPAYAGIPLTHRKVSSSFAVVPGYEDPAKENSSLDWAKLATGVGTLVFLMAVKNIAALTEKLIHNGKPPDTPVAIIRWGTRAEQKTVVGTLADIASAVEENHIKPPAVIVVGEVVRLREELSWYEKKPLFGHRVLVTREHTYGFEALEDLGAEVIEFPTIEVVPPESWEGLDRATDRFIEGLAGGGPKGASWLIFTSANGVRHFMGRLLERGIDIRDLKGARVCAIGSKTAAEVSSHGIRVDLVPEEFRAEGLVEAFRAEAGGGDLAGTRFLLPRAEKAREVFPEAVRALGGEIEAPAAYRTVKPETGGKRLRRFLREGRISVATFTSASTFNNFREIMGEEADELLRGVRIAAIGPVTARAIERAGHRADIMPAEATVEALVAEIINKLSAAPV
ncbi:MAG: uroporphyrinogen-III C-methyltransferase [Thermodesulfovibrionales bacterium]